MCLEVLTLPCLDQITPHFKTVFDIHGKWWNGSGWNWHRTHFHNVQPCFCRNYVLINKNCYCTILVLSNSFLTFLQSNRFCEKNEMGHWHSSESTTMILKRIKWSSTMPHAWPICFPNPHCSVSMKKWIWLPGQLMGFRPFPLLSDTNCLLSVRANVLI